MKKILLLFICIITIISSSFGQNLSLSELFTMCNKPNWTEVDEYLLKKGWVYHESSKGDDTHYSTITWSYNKQYYSDKAQGWIHLMTYDGYPNKISYNIFNKNAYTTIKNGISALGMALKANSIEDDEIITNYENSSFIVKISTSKSTTDTYSDNSSTSYLITVIKKSGIYDPDNGLKKEYDDFGNIILEYTLKNGEFNGKGTEYYSDGTVKDVSYFVNGKRNGLSIEYDEDGNIKSKTNYLNGELHGLAEFYKDKIPTMTGTYKNDKKNGLFKEFDDEGTLTIEYTMLNGLKNGISKFYENNKIKSIIEWKNDLKNGKFKEYDINGFLSVESNYINDTLNGVFKMYENNKLKQIGYIVNDEKSGNFKEFDESGNILKEYFMKSDMLDGIYKEYVYKEGKLLLKFVKSFKNDEKNGVSYIIKYDGTQTDTLLNTTYLNGVENGLFKTTKSDSIVFGSYKNGVLDGSYKVFLNFTTLVFGGISGDTANAHLILSGNYVEGKKSGTWKTYTFGKHLLEEGQYSDDLQSGEWKYYFSNYSDSNGNLYPYSGKLFLIENYLNGELNGKKTRFAYLNRIIVPCDSINKGKINSSDTCREFAYKKVLEISNYKNNKLNGAYEYQDSSGIVIKRGEFINDIKNGVWLEGYLNRVSDSSYFYSFYKGNYTNGLRNGTWVSYITDSFIYEKRDFLNGKLNGQVISYNRNNKPTEIKYYVDDKFKKVVIYDSLGVSKKHEYDILQETNFEFICRKTDYFTDTIISQDYVLRKIDGDTDIDEIFDLVFTIRKINNTDCYASGEYKVMNKDNKISILGSYFKTNKTGKWKMFFYDQNVYIEQDFKDNIGGLENYYNLKTGLPYSGKFIIKYDNEKIKSEFKISDGSRDGKSRYYDESEKLIKTETYDKGLLK